MVICWSHCAGKKIRLSTMCGPTVGIHTIYFLVLAIFCPSQSNVFIKHCYIGRWVQKQVMFIVMEHLLRFDFDAYVVGSKHCYIGRQIVNA